MDCTWVKSLRGVQVESPKTRGPEWFTLPVTLNGVDIKALIDMGCGSTVVRKAKGPFTPEVVPMQCIHRDVWKYRTKMVTIGIGTQIFTCRVGVIPQLDCGVLIGRNCPILA